MQVVVCQSRHTQRVDFGTWVSLYRFPSETCWNRTGGIQRHLSYAGRLRSGVLALDTGNYYHHIELSLPGRGTAWIPPLPVRLFAQKTRVASRTERVTGGLMRSWPVAKPRGECIITTSLRLVREYVSFTERRPHAASELLEQPSQRFTAFSGDAPIDDVECQK
jgi:hypothetical protein